MASITTTERRPRSVVPARTTWRSEKAAPYFFVSPFVLVFLGFTVGPAIFAVYLSLHSWAGLGSMTFVGFDNYVTLFTDPDFLAAAGNTAIYMAASLFLIIPLALFVASLLNQRGIRFRNLFQTVYFLPMILSPVIVALVFNIIFDKNAGLLNAVLTALIGIPPIGWLENPDWVKVSIVIVMVWRYTGYLVIFFLAGLQGVPRELYEAVALDGGGPLRAFTAVTLPGLKPVMAFVAVIVTAGSAQIFEEPYILTKGGPGTASISVTMYLYRVAFEQGYFGLAAACGVVLFIVIFGLGRLLTWAFGIGTERE
ncbi:sugar ABC transporter permease [Microbacterium sp. H1-D42]|uniref:carbohydrate ABC transporter permease n=1 Tax=Microbacterium sp. H1-D42 TaxID=2925844 RepID=UPI001F53D8F5|nr:sugar ABC transporter permease [Microbacterium sp. H1-D42]UNK70465.1 sugar ABC transporter permease [Microbacterium sp. H1-D42]